MELRSIHPSRIVECGKWTEANCIEGQSFIIKPYQRGYRWGKENVRKLLDDILHYVNYDVQNLSDLMEYIEVNYEKDDNTRLFDFYCLQALSVKRENTNEYELIDGQQRLTTILIIYELLAAFINSKEDMPDTPPYSILYERSGAAQQKLDFAKELHQAIPYGIGSTSTRKAYLEGHEKRDETWFIQYKEELSKRIKSIGDGESDGSLRIDLYFISNAAEEVVDFVYQLNDNKGKARLLGALFDCIRWNLLFLWYEIPSEIKAEEEFASLNANKISLTNAELIKALVLKSDETGKVFENAGHRWEAIEQGLCSQELWGFIGGEEKSTRIDLILELFARKDAENAFRPDPKNENALFDWYENLAQKGKNQGDFSKKVIEGIEQIFFRISEWYDDVEIYHYIGLLTCFRTLIGKEKTQEELVRLVFDDYEASIDKKDFLDKLKQRIKGYLLTGLKKSDSIDHLEDLSTFFSYEDPQQQPYIKAILWMLNAWETIESAENNEGNREKKHRKPVVVRRLPFSRINGRLHNTQYWTLEHILPQNPEKDSSQSSAEKEIYPFILAAYKKACDTSKKSFKEMMSDCQNLIEKVHLEETGTEVYIVTDSGKVLVNDGEDIVEKLCQIVSLTLKPKPIDNNTGVMHSKSKISKHATTQSGSLD